MDDPPAMYAARGVIRRYRITYLDVLREFQAS